MRKVIPDSVIQNNVKKIFTVLYFFHEKEYNIYIKCGERSRMDRYTVEILFGERKKVGANLYEIMKEQGYTKISFSKKINISRPTLNHLFEGEISSITTFEKYLDKIQDVLQIQEQELMIYRPVENLGLRAAFSRNEPEDYIPDKEEQEMFEILGDLMNLCDFYY